MAKRTNQVAWRLSAILAAMLVGAIVRMIGYVPLLSALSAPLVPTSEPVSRGEEFVYTGRFLERSRGLIQYQHSGVIKLSAVVTSADPVQGYAVLLLDQSDPEEQVETDRYSPDLKLVGPRGAAAPTMDSMLQFTPVPFMPRAKLTVGRQWRRSEPIPLLFRRSLPVVYKVVGETTINGERCVKVVKRLAHALPFFERPVGPKHALTAYQQTLCVQPTSGRVYSSDTEIEVRTGLVAMYTMDNVRLEHVNQLSDSELALRVSHARMAARAQKALGR